MAPLFTGLRLGFGRSAEVAGGPQGLQATGGTVTAAGITPGNGYRYHVFTAPGTFAVTAPGAYGDTVEYLVVGGGGGGGPQHGGGGGAGGLRSNSTGGGPGGPSPTIESSYPVAPGTYPVVVGSGGALVTGPTPNGPGGNVGSYSSFNDANTNGGGILRSEGGGAGGAWTTNYTGSFISGGSGGAKGQGAGGGESGGSGNRVANAPGTPAPNQGFPAGSQSPGSGAHGSAGGGGAGGVGGNSSGTTNTDSAAGPGGAGRAVPAFPGPLLSPEIPSPNRSDWENAVGPTGLYAGGGGGGLWSDSPIPGRGLGGSGGGGIGGGRPDYGAGSGISGTGGGGGGAYGYVVPTGAGGSGIVIIRYLA